MDQMNDVPLQRNLKVGTVSVGLIGLDVALTQILAQPELDIQDAVGQVYAEIARRNYVPALAEDNYRQAIRQEIQRLRGGQASASSHLEVRILGTGCVSCNNLQKQVFEIVSDRGIVADVFQVHDLDEIGRFGVLQTPALIINGQVKSIGRIPTRAQIEEWLLDAIS